MSPYDEQNTAAWWVAGIVGAGVFIWKAIFHMRRDTRDDRDAKGRQDLILQLREEIDRKDEFITQLHGANERLSTQLDAEVTRRREVEEANFGCRQREKHLERIIRQLEEQIAKGGGIP